MPTGPATPHKRLEMERERRDSSPRPPACQFRAVLARASSPVSVGRSLRGFPRLALPAFTTGCRRCVPTAGESDGGDHRHRTAAAGREPQARWVRVASRMNLNSLLAAVGGLAPVAAVDVLAALAEAIGAREVSFLIADFSGRSTDPTWPLGRDRTKCGCRERRLRNGCRWLGRRTDRRWPHRASR